MTGAHQKLLAMALLVAWAAPTWAINKCTGPDGKVVFQDAACAGKGEVLDVRPASGRSPAPSKPATVPVSVEPGSAPSASAKPQSDVERMEADFAKSQRSRRKRDLEVVAIPNARLALRRHNESCSQRREQLQAKKRQSNNNLAGAVWEQSISEEMSALSRECGTQSQQLLSELAALRQECSALSCVPEGQ